MLIISDISVKCVRRSNLSDCGSIFKLGLFQICKHDNSSHQVCLILPGLHSGWWCSGITQINMLCSEAHFSNIHARAINMNWWSRNCKACNPVQNRSSDRYPTLPFITKSSKLLDGREMSYFAQFLSSCPWASNSIFHQKLQRRKENKHGMFFFGFVFITILFLSRGGSVIHWKEGDRAGLVGGLEAH